MPAVFLLVSAEDTILFPGGLGRSLADGGLWFFILEGVRGEVDVGRVA